MNIMNLLNVVLYVEDGMFSERNKWVNLHLLISKFFCYALIGSISVEMNVKLVEFLNGDSTIMKISSVIGLVCSLLVNGFFTKREWIVRARRYYCSLSLVATVGLVATNMMVIYEDNVVIRFIISIIITNSVVTVLSNSISDTMNNLFQGSDRTVYKSKEKVISISASLAGVVMAFFIHLDLNGLIVFESVIYAVLCLDDLFIMKKLQKQVFGDAEESPKTTEEKAA